MGETDSIQEEARRAGKRKSLYLGVGVVLLAFGIVLLIYFFGTLQWAAFFVSLVLFVMGSLFAAQSVKARDLEDAIRLQAEEREEAAEPDRGSGEDAPA